MNSCVPYSRNRRGPLWDRIPPFGRNKTPHVHSALLLLSTRCMFPLPTHQDMRIQSKRHYGQRTLNESMIGNICPSRVELVTMVPRTSILFPTSITGFCGGVRMAIITDFSFHLRFPRVAEPPYFWQPIAVDSFKCLWARDVINDANHICL